MDAVRKIDSRLHFGRLLPLESAQNQWYAKVPAGTTLDAILQPAYWAHYAGQLKIDNMIRVKCEDGSWMADLVVVYATRLEIKCKVYIFKQLDDSDTEGETAIHKVVWKGPDNKFAVIHKTTKEVIKDHLYPKSEAIKYLEEHLKSLV